MSIDNREPNAFKDLKPQRTDNVVRPEMKITGRERIQTALAHKKPDRVPVDFGACNQTTIHAGVIAGLRDYYGLEKRKVKSAFFFLNGLEDFLYSSSFNMGKATGSNRFFNCADSRLSDISPVGKSFSQ